MVRHCAIVGSLILFILVACGKDESQANAAASCRLDRSIDVGTNDIKNGVFVGLELNQLKFDKTPTSLQNTPDAVGQLELHLFDIRYAARFADPGQPTGFLGGRIELVGPGARWSQGFANAYVGNFSLSRNDTTENKKFIYSTSETRTKQNDDKEPATTSMRVVIEEQKLVSVFATYPLMKEGNYTGTNESLCLKSANVKTPFAKK